MVDADKQKNMNVENRNMIEIIVMISLYSIPCSNIVDNCSITNARRIDNETCFMFMAFGFI